MNSFLECAFIVYIVPFIFIFFHFKMLKCHLNNLCYKLKLYSATLPFDNVGEEFLDAYFSLVYLINHQ